VNIVESFAEPEPHLVRKSLLKSAFVHGKHKVQVLNRLDLDFDSMTFAP
jgi:hypothetical protein